MAGKRNAGGATGHDRQLELGLNIGPGGSGRPDRAAPARPAYRQRLGALGEQRTVAWYEAAGYRVVARNWRCRDGEIDLVALGADVVVFCEVKTRTSDRFGSPAEAVTPLKQRRLRSLAVQFLREHPQPVGTMRFDVASVGRGQVDVIEAAF
jgi:putative endonuclease